MVLREEHLQEWKEDNFERKKEHYYGESSIQECQLSSLEDNNGHWCIVHFAPKLFSFCFPLPFIFFYYSFNSRITTNKSILFLGPRGPLVEPSILHPSRPVPSTRPQQFFLSSYIQAYMPYGSSEVSSNQPDGTKGSHRCPLDPLGPCRPTPWPPGTL